jgi:hypothetical protein
VTKAAAIIDKLFGCTSLPGLTEEEAAHRLRPEGSGVHAVPITKSKDGHNEH